MDQVASQVTQDVESGKYFSEAKEWYHHIYIKPASECALMYIFAMGAIALWCITIFNLYSVFSYNKDITIVARLNNTIDYYPKLKRLADHYDQDIIKFMASNYVKAKESYVPNDFQNNYKFIYRNSSKEVFDKYKQYIAPSNPKSPLVLYGWQGKITVDIKEVLYNDDKNLTVMFTKKGYDNYNKLLFTQNLKALIKYRMENIDFKTKKESRINFAVDGYSVNEVKQRENDQK